MPLPNANEIISQLTDAMEFLSQAQELCATKTPLRNAINKIDIDLDELVESIEEGEFD